MKINVFPIRSSLQHDDLDLHSQNFVSSLEEEGLEFCFVELDRLYDDCDLSLILVQSGGSEGKFLELFSKIKAPIYILTYGLNNSLAASIEILSFLKKNNIEGEILHGTKDYIVSRIKELGRKKTLGIIGKPSDWLIASNVDANELRKKFNMSLKFIDTQELIDEYNKLEDLEVEDNNKFDREEKKKAHKVLTSLNNLVDRYSLDGLTIRCFALLDTIKTTSCLALARLNDRGIISSCEGDVPALVTMEVVKSVTGQVSFQANPAIIDVDSNTIILAHCTIPLTMCDSYSYDTHFESGIGLGIKGELPKGKITIVKIGADLNKFFISRGELIENQDDRSKCRTQVKLKLEESVSYFLTNPLGNHHIIVLGDRVKEIEDYLYRHGLTKVC